MTSRASPLARLLIPAVLGLTLCACHKARDADGESSRGLKVEAYDAPIPKAPLNGKLDTLPPQAAASSTPAVSGAPVAASDLPPT
jgi:hypothetical protein